MISKLVFCFIVLVFANASIAESKLGPKETQHKAEVTAEKKPHPKCKTGEVLENGVFDCAGIKLGAQTPCTSDAEGQAPILTLKNATVKNLVIDGKAGGDGIHCSLGDCVIENVAWEEICEDAATLNKKGKSLRIIGGSAHNTIDGPGGKPDKVFQQNAHNSTTYIEGGFRLTGVNGKLWRSCGNCPKNGGPRNLVINDVIIDSEIGSVAGANSNFDDTVSIKNLSIKKRKDKRPPICVEYIGVDKRVNPEESKKVGERWGTKTCNVKESDISLI